LRVSADEPLSELWWWINRKFSSTTLVSVLLTNYNTLDSRDLLSSPTHRINGYDFSYQGLQGIWEGFQALPQQPESDPTPRNMYLELPHEETMFESSHLKPHAGRRSSHSPEVHGDFQAAIATIASRKGSEALMWRPTVVTNKVVQRSIALQLCGWSLKEEELNDAIKRWEKDGKHSRAACWLVFTGQYTKAVELLMRSKGLSCHFNP
jgi:WD repeat-containing protein mio